MFRLDRSCAVAVLACFALGVWPFEAQAQWVAGKTIRNVRVVGESGAVTFMTVDAIVNPGGCPSTDFYGIHAADNAKNALAVLLSDKLSGSKITFYIPPESPCDQYGRPRVAHVMLGDD